MKWGREEEKEREGREISFCNSPIDIGTSARAGVSGSERECVQIGAGVSADRRESERENWQENDKNREVLYAKGEKRVREWGRGRKM